MHRILLALREEILRQGKELEKLEGVGHELKRKSSKSAGKQVSIEGTIQQLEALHEVSLAHPWPNLIMIRKYRTYWDAGGLAGKLRAQKTGEKVKQGFGQSEAKKIACRVMQQERKIIKE